MTTDFDKMISDTDHWQNKPPPLSPNEQEIAIYKNLIADTKPVYLLGMTKSLVELCDFAVDLNPIKINKPTIKANWLELEGIKAGAIIGDGVVNLAGLGLVKKASLVAQKLICRVFLKKFDWMRYATHFPNEFPGCLVIPTQADIAIVQWDFQ